MPETRVATYEAELLTALESTREVREAVEVSSRPRLRRRPGRLAVDPMPAAPVYYALDAEPEPASLSSCDCADCREEAAIPNTLNVQVAYSDIDGSLATNYWLGGEVSAALKLAEGETVPGFEQHRPGSSRYGSSLRMAFEFLRAHADGRYTDRTLMRVMRAQDNLLGGFTPPAASMPTITLAVSPFEYDEDTECKKGGTLGVAVTWESEGNKSLLAVHRNTRRKGIGRALNVVVNGILRNPSYWVGRQNDDGQHFLLGLGMVPTAINGSGAVRYAYPHDNPDEG